MRRRLIFLIVAVWSSQSCKVKSPDFGNRAEAIKPNCIFQTTYDGTPVVAKVTVRGIDGTPDPEFEALVPNAPSGPETKEARNITYSRDGQAPVFLPNGHYRFWISKGPEFEVYSKEIEVFGDRDCGESIQLRRNIETNGYLAIDLHQHSNASSDSAIFPEIKVLSNLAEGLTIMVSSDHNRLTDYAPFLNRWKEMKLALIGTEYSTPNEFHANALPLQPQAKLPDVHIPVAEAIDGLRNAGDGQNFIQINHPNYQTNPFDVRKNWDAGFDGMEVMNAFEMTYAGADQLYKNLASWFYLLSKGRKVVGTGVSDSHMLSHQEVGYPRTYVFFQNPVTPTAAALVDGLKDSRNVFISNGPLIRFEAILSGKRHPIGSSPILNGPRTVEFEVAVVAQPWIILNEVAIFKNGIIVKRFPLIDTDKTAKLAATRFELHVDQKSYVLAIAKGVGSLFPFTDKKNAFPFALTNPIYFDVK